MEWNKDMALSNAFDQSKRRGKVLLKKDENPNGEGGNAHRNIRSKKSINKSFHPS